MHSNLDPEQSAPDGGVGIAGPSPALDESLVDAYTARLATSLPELKERMSRACASAARAVDDVTLVGVTKSHPAEVIEAALRVGLTDLGENRVEELTWKRAAFDGRGARWHLIGHVQSRKSAAILGIADLFHALDSLKLAKRLSRQLAEVDAELGAAELDVLLQVNTSGEASKGGFDAEREVDHIHEVLEHGALRVRGLMTMAPFTDNEAVVRKTFVHLRELHERLRATTSYSGTELSMGMTSDFHVAIEEGSTLVRVGTALFGERS